ncbi:hypothetical protein PPTG_23587 [Phytophthora nicotianae INRA-310]|uniref:Uncharacterized protein n=2 Tax=Phytophthora nicotianae TaxID=4792 RepID=W2PXJ8_PHYN3|nr:hypothetical protein PPTG_23587 [Phytophthora nicotianae INRA-310]ETN04745.1 hypothetical protein PPTG_23587 [Phytophthora nicotianae INRA-310]ETO68750.1 hypothetical protein F444_14475 [Phytophthora nicotianae P1976]
MKTNLSPTKAWAMQCQVPGSCPGRRPITKSASRRLRITEAGRLARLLKLALTLRNRSCFGLFCSPF